MSKSFDRQRLAELVGMLCDEVISDEQFNELELILFSSKEARRLYSVYITIAHHLQGGICHSIPSKTSVLDSALTNEPLSADISDLGLAGPLDKIPAERATSLRESRFFSRLATGNQPLVGPRAFKLLAVAVLMCGCVWYLLHLSEIRNEPNRSFAHVLGSVNVVWDSPATACSVGELLESRRLTFQRGVLHVRFNNGASVAVEGPADFEVINEKRAYLHRGQVAVYAPESAKGFRLDTPHAEVIDLGTEFGLSVDSFGESQVHVFSGEVEYSGHGQADKKVSLTAGLAVAVDRNGNSRPVELKERSFEVPREVLWTRYRYASSISTQFIAGNTTEIAGGVPGRIGGGWTSQWSFDCKHGEIVEDKTLVNDDRPLGPGLDNHLDVVARSPDGGKFELKVHRGFDSTGEKFDSRNNYIVQFLMRINSDVSQINRIRVSDFSNDQDVSRHTWRLAANRDSSDEVSGQLKWRGLPLQTHPESTELKIRQWTKPNIKKEKVNRQVHADLVYRVVVEVQPGKNRYRISLSDGEKTLVGDWTKDTQRIGNGPRLERRLEWFFEATNEISVSFDSIRIQNDTKFQAE